VTLSRLLNIVNTLLSERRIGAEESISFLLSVVQHGFSS
jgi:hypothetical protein